MDGKARALALYPPCLAAVVALHRKGPDDGAHKRMVRVSPRWVFTVYIHDLDVTKSVTLGGYPRLTTKRPEILS